MTRFFKVTKKKAITGTRYFVDDIIILNDTTMFVKDDELIMQVRMLPASILLGFAIELDIVDSIL